MILNKHLKGSMAKRALMDGWMPQKKSPSGGETR